MFRVIFDLHRGQRVPLSDQARRTALETVRQLPALAGQPYVVEFVAGMADAHVSERRRRGQCVCDRIHPGAPRARWRSRLRDVGVPHRRRGGCVGSKGFPRSFPAVRAPRTGHSRWRRDPSPFRGDLRPRRPCSRPPLSTGTLEHAREALAPRHLGTLGGGNHFLELDRDAGGLWLLAIHSGLARTGRCRCAAPHARRRRRKQRRSRGHQRVDTRRRRPPE